MSEITGVLSAIDRGDPHAADQLLPLVYDELRKLAARQLAQEQPGQSFVPTALVHEAYVRLVDQSHPPQFDNRRHFFAAAAEAMRRILIEAARRKRRHKHGGDLRRVELSDNEPIALEPSAGLLDVDEALTRLAAEDPDAAQVVKLRVFAGLSVEQAAEVLDMSRASAYRHWTYARAWLRDALGGDRPAP